MDARENCNLRALKAMAMPEKSGTGIIVGRFQTYKLNAEHQRLIDTVVARHKRVLVFLGSNPAPSEVNPLDFKWRRELFDGPYKDKVEVLEVPDAPDDRIWSQELDRRILELRPEGEVMLYGTASGFCEAYSGRYPTEVLEAEEEGETFDLDTSEGRIDPASFRAGAIYAMLCRFPTAYPTVDIAVLRDDGREVLLARKENELKWRFPGGFADPSDESFEITAIRELVEECGEIRIDNLLYLGSLKMDDWRYRGTLDSVITHFYVCEWVDGDAQPDDDIAELRWFKTEGLLPEALMPVHRPLLELLKLYLS